MADDSSRGSRPGAAALGDFLSHDLAELLSRHRRLDLSSRVLGWFQETVRDVPAYSRFLAARGLDPAKADTFVGMYVNDWTLDFGPRGRAAVAELLRRGHAAGIIPKLVEPEFVE